MTRLLALLIVASCAPAYSQGFYTCEPPDWLTIVDDGPDRAIVTYSNSINDCSNNVSTVLTSDAGVSVRVIITVGSEGDGYKEHIVLEPLDPLMMAFPPEGWLQDGEQQGFIVQGGLS